MAGDISMLTTAIGWALLIGAGGVYYVYSSNKSKNKAKSQILAKQPIKASDDRKEPKAKKSKKDAGLSSGDQGTKAQDKSQKKKKAPTPPKTEQKQETAKIVANDSDNDDAAETRKFAAQLAQAQAGTKFAGQTTAASRQKSVKQSRAQEKQAKDSGNITAGSATGGDADDDQSFTDSPEVHPTDIATTVSNGISDMLEAPTSGPSVLRVTEPTNPKPAKKETSKPAAAPAETKKQRQNRRKIEEAKVAREQDEKERKILEEKQRRTAREAEGRAPKDGRQFMATQQPASSAWTASSANGNEGASKANTSNVDLLDTTEATPKSNPTATTKSDLYSESEVAGSNWVDDEEAKKVAIEESREWEQVQKKKRKAKKETKDSNDREGAGTASSTDEKEYTVPPMTARSGPGQKWTADLTYVDKDDKVHEVQKEVQDSEWVVS